MSAWDAVFPDPLPYVRCTKVQLRMNDKYCDTLALCVTIVIQTAISAPRGFVNDCAIPRNVSARRIFQSESALHIVSYTETSLTVSAATLNDGSMIESPVSATVSLATSPAMFVIVCRRPTR